MYEIQCLFDRIRMVGWPNCWTFISLTRNRCGFVSWTTGFVQFLVQVLERKALGLQDYGILVIETDSQINKNDTFKAVYRIADQFENNR